MTGNFIRPSSTEWKASDTQLQPLGNCLCRGCVEDVGAKCNVLNRKLLSVLHWNLVNHSNIRCPTNTYKQVLFGSGFQYLLLVFASLETLYLAEYGD